MKNAYFGSKTEPATQFNISDTLFIVQTRSRESLTEKTGDDGNEVIKAALHAVADCDVRWKIALDGATIFTLPPGEVLVDRLRTLRKHPDVLFAVPALINNETHVPVFYTEMIYIQFRRDMSMDQMEAQLRGVGLIPSRKVDYAEHAYWVKSVAPIGPQVFDKSVEMLARGDVTYCYPEILEARPRRAAHANQWHLQKTTIRYADEIDASANVVKAHEYVTGHGRIIAVIDDSVDIDHPEFGGPGKIVHPRNFGSGKEDDPRPVLPDHHGTAVAGVACANGYHGACGVAPDAALMPIRIDMSANSEQGAKAIRWAVDNGADIINCSWGLGQAFPLWYENLPHAQSHRFAPEAQGIDLIDACVRDEKNRDGARRAGLFDSHMGENVSGGANGRANDGAEGRREARERYLKQFALTDALRDAFRYAVEYGRNGKGCLIFCASGNSNTDIAEHDGMAASPYVIAVGACNEKGKRSVYSNFGDALFCVFPSDDFAYQSYAELRSRGVWTLDTASYPQDQVVLPNVKGSYLQSFGGTSSAAPGAAGVAALILSVNPSLDWQEVKQIMAKSCTKIDEAEGRYSAETGRSRQYGYGRLDAAQAVKLAREYTLPSS